MSIKMKKFSILAALLGVLVIAAQCGVAQRQQAVQGSQQIETQVEKPATAEEDNRTQHHEAGHDEQEHNHPEEEHETDEVIELSAVNLAGGKKLKVLATTNIVGDLVGNVGGDMIELATMLPVGADPHTFVPTPQDAAAIADAHVVFMNGLNLEEFLEELINNAGGEAAVVAVATHVDTREFEEMDAPGQGDEKGDGHEDGPADHSDRGEDDHDEAGDDHEDEHGLGPQGVDPHVWMTPTNAMVMVHNIEHALSELDPANAASYEANANAYEAQLQELDAWVLTQVESIPAENRELVTDHDALGYYTSRYGLDVVGTVVPAYSTNAEPSARELAELQETIQKFETKAVFVGTTVNPVLAAQVAEDTGIKLIPLYTGSLGQAGSGVETYVDLIRYNTTAIVTALK
jgi:ABC-type Zn uptake system ZnuABC Zn-binding protein ZnuA